jgi:hypothetical protein
MFLGMYGISFFTVYGEYMLEILSYFELVCAFVLGSAVFFTIEMVPENYRFYFLQSFCSVYTSSKKCLIMADYSLKFVFSSLVVQLFLYL